MSRRIAPRVYFLLAKQVPEAVIIARMRAKLFHVVKWNYERDKKTEGAWLKGQFYFERADLSFDGKHLVYFALGPWKGVWSWTGVCEPPSLTALMFWEHDSTWEGGGLFLDDHTLWLDIPPDQPASNRGHFQPSKNLEKLYTLKFRKDQQEESIYPRHLARDGWVKVVGEGGRNSYDKLSPNRNYLLKLTDPRLFERMNDRLNLRIPRRFTLRRVSTNETFDAIIDKKVTWADWGIDGQLLVARDGIINQFDLEGSLQSKFTLDCRTFTPES